MTIPYGNSGALGVNFAQVYTANSSSTGLYPYASGVPFELGQLAQGTDGSMWVFVVYSTGGSTGLGYVCTYDQAFSAVMLSTDNDIYGKKVGVSPAAATAAQYGWLQVYGTCDDIRCEQDALANATLGPTADPGQVDDAALTGLFIKGMTLTTARGASDGNAPGVLNWPVIDHIYELET